MNTDCTLSKADDISPDAIEPIVRETLVVLALIAFMGIASLLPGTGMELPSTAISVGDLVVAAGSLGIVASLIWVGPKLRTVAERILDGPASVVRDVGSIARNLALFAAVLVAHWGFSAVLRPLIEVEWLYDAVFLLVALVPLGLVAYRVYTSLEPLTTFVTRRLVGRTTRHAESSGDHWRT